GCAAGCRGGPPCREAHLRAWGRWRGGSGLRAPKACAGVDRVAVRFPPELIEEIKSRVDIVEIVGQYVHLRPSGRNYVGLCPFHSGKTPSFTGGPDKQLFPCFGCQTGGDVFAFLMKRTGIGFAEAVQQLAQRAGIDWERLTQSPEDAARERKRRELLE